MYILMNDQEYEEILEILKQSQHPRSEGLIMKLKSGKVYDEDCIHLIWQVDDVITYAEDHGYPVPSRARAAEILKAIDDNHDCNIGVTWDTLNEYM